MIGLEGGQVEGYAEALVILGNCEFTFDSVFCQSKTERPGLWGPSGFNKCILYHLDWDFGTLINRYRLRPAESCDLDG